MADLRAQKMERTKTKEQEEASTIKVSMASWSTMRA